jgi:hypothetical protein
MSEQRYGLYVAKHGLQPCEQFHGTGNHFIQEDFWRAADMVARYQSEWMTLEENVWRYMKGYFSSLDMPEWLQYRELYSHHSMLDQEIPYMQIHMAFQSYVKSAHKIIPNVHFEQKHEQNYFMNDPFSSALIMPSARISYSDVLTKCLESLAYQQQRKLFEEKLLEYRTEALKIVHIHGATPNLIFHYIQDKHQGMTILGQRVAYPEWMDDDEIVYPIINQIRASKSSPYDMRSLRQGGQ